MEDVVVAVGGALVDFSFNNFLLLDDLLSIASLALVFFVDDLAFTTAVVTRSLGLGVHAGSELNHLGDHTASLAASALLDSAFFASETVAAGADSLSVDCNLGLLTIINFFERHFEGVLDGLAFLRSLGPLSSATATSEHVHQVIHAATAASTAFSSHGIDTAFVIDVTLLSVGKNFVSLLNFLELLLITTAIGVVISSSLMVGLLDLAHRGLLANS